MTKRKWAACAWLSFCILHSAFCAPPHAGEPLVEVKTIDPTILIDLRYATARNVTSRAIYPANAPCLIRKSVAERLRAAQTILRQRGFSLKIWDAFRPSYAQEALWNFSKNRHFVADPDRRALHTWGVAVDATLADAQGHDVAMPTDFDSFSPAAGMHYANNSPAAAANLRLLQGAMGSAGFLGMRTEWWHFIASDWRHYAPVTAEQAAAFAR